MVKFVINTTSIIMTIIVQHTAVPEDRSKMCFSYVDPNWTKAVTFCYIYLRVHRGNLCSYIVHPGAKHPTAT